jgi:catechol 2,3-dioxygenase-like lactoylglutathione lyase family enzyme
VQAPASCFRYRSLIVVLVQRPSRSRKAGWDGHFANYATIRRRCAERYRLLRISLFFRARSGADRRGGRRRQRDSLPASAHGLAAAREVKMLDHIGLKVTDVERARTFYDQALKPLGVSVVMEVPKEKTGSTPYLGYGEGQKPYFWIGQEGRATEQLHVAFVAASRAKVDEFYRAAMAAGGRDNGPPGLRPYYHPAYYGAFVLDPDGHNIEAVCHAPE